MPTLSRATLAALAFALLSVAGDSRADGPPTTAEARLIVTSLLDPVKLSTLRPRGASDRIDKAMYWLHVSPDAGAVIAQVIEDFGWTGTAKGEILARQLLWNLGTLEALGCLSAENLERLRRGRAPSITRGEHAGEIVELDHVIPVAHAPHWSNVIANHQYLPQSVNRSKGDRMTEKERDFERELKAAGF